MFNKSIFNLMISGGSVSGLKLGAEDKICIDFANRLKAWTLENRLTAVWTHVANELAGGSKNAKIRYAIAKALGLISGTADYLFLWDGGCAALEFKAGKNPQSPNQKDFQQWCIVRKVPYFVVYSADQGQQILQDLGVLK